MKDMSPLPDDDLAVPYGLLFFWLILLGFSMLGVWLLEEAGHAAVYC